MVYLFTMIREVGWGDSAELALVARKLSVTHTPGYPVHTILGHLLGSFIQEPAIATNLLSVITSSFAVAVMSLIIMELTGNVAAAYLIPLFWGFMRQIWDMAIITEVYNVNIFFVALGLYLFILWYRTKSPKYLITASVIWGLSLGTYLPNIMFFPILIFFLWQPRQKRWHRLITFLSIIGFIELLLVLFVLYRAQFMDPFNTLYPPNTFNNAIKYFTGYQAKPFTLQKISFYIERATQQGKYFSKNFLYSGILLGIAGLVYQLRYHRDMAILLGWIFATNFIFFTQYRGDEFITQITPSYFIFSLWIAYCFTFVKKLMPNYKLRSNVFMASTLMCLVCVQLIYQLPGRIERANSNEVTDFTLSSLENFPPHSVVIGVWERYAPLLYFQKIHNQRLDVLLLQRRSDYLNTVDNYLGSRPVLIDSHPDEATGKYDIERYYRRWFMISLK